MSLGPLAKDVGSALTFLERFALFDPSDARGKNPVRRLHRQAHDDEFWMFVRLEETDGESKLVFGCPVNLDCDDMPAEFRDVVMNSLDARVHDVMRTNGFKLTGLDPQHDEA